MLWYQFGPFRAYYETGRHDEVIALADATLRTAKHIEELFYWRGRAQQARGDLPAARASWERALELNPNYADARAALAALAP
jgi:tetratricopeptide (TPR) repeat protein